MIPAGYRGGFRLLVLAPYPLQRAPNQRFRFEQYVAIFEELGWHVDIRPLMNTKVYGWFWGPGRVPQKAAFLASGLVRRLADMLRARRYDSVLIVRECFPAGPAYLEHLLRRVARRIVFDFDDSIWLPSESERNRLFAWLKRPEKTARILAISDLAIAGNAYLADYARRYARRVTIIPTTIDTEIYMPERRADRDEVVVGWSGSATTSSYLDMVVAPLRKLQRECGVKLLTVGAPSWRPPELEIDAQPWSLEIELPLLRRIDIGLMPLTDDPWSRGKCGLKALQYMALKSAAVVSPVGVNREIVEHGRNGLHARGEDDWYAMIRACVEDSRLRRELGERARQTVEERYSVRANAARWVEALAW